MTEQQHVVHVRREGDHFVVFVGTSAGEPVGKVYPGTKAACQGVAGTFSRRDGIPVQVTA